MNPADIARLRSAIRDVVDFPKPGIVFKDVTPILGDPDLFRLAIGIMAEIAGRHQVKKIVGIDARGFIFGAAVAAVLGIGFVPVRKKGKLPWKTESIAYDLEYGSNTVEMHTDAIAPGERVVLVDDLLATGGTAGAAAALVKKLGGELVELVFLIELEFLHGREKLENKPATSLIKYS